METFSALLDICAGNSPVPGEFPAQRPVTRSFDVFFDLRLNKRLNEQSWGWWFETLSCSLWRHCSEAAQLEILWWDAASYKCQNVIQVSLKWRHNDRHGFSNHQRPDCLLNRLFRCRSKRTSKLCVTGLCEGNSTVTGEFPAQRPSDAKMFPFDDVIMYYKFLLVKPLWNERIRPI